MNDYNSPYLYDFPSLHWCFHCPSSTKWESTSFLTPYHQQFLSAPSPPRPTFPPAILEQIYTSLKTVQDLVVASQERNSRMLSTFNHMGLVLQEMQSDSTSIDTPELSDVTTFTSVLESAYDESNTEVADMVKSHLDLELPALGVGDTIPQYIFPDALSSASIDVTELEFSLPSFSVKGPLEFDCKVFDVVPKRDIFVEFRSPNTPTGLLPSVFSIHNCKWVDTGQISDFFDIQQYNQIKLLDAYKLFDEMPHFCSKVFDPGPSAATFILPAMEHYLAVGHSDEDHLFDEGPQLIKSGILRNLHSINDMEQDSRVQIGSIGSTIAFQGDLMKKLVFCCDRRGEIQAARLVIQLQGISNFSKPARSLFLEIQKIDNQYYPETLHRLFIINAGSGFKVLWKAIKTFLDQRTLAKIQVLGSNYTKTLLEVVDPSNLPNFLGAECTCSNYGGCLFSDRVAYLLCELCAEVGPDASKMAMVPVYVQILRDYESKVRTAVAGEITVFLLTPPSVEELSSDLSRHALSVKDLVMIGITLISRKNTTVGHLLQIFPSLLMDEPPQIRLNIIRKLQHVNQVIRIDLLSQSFLLVLVELSEDRHWMVQLATIELIPLLVSQLGVSLCNDRLGALLYAIPVHYQVGLTHFTLKDFILVFWLFAHYPSRFTYLLAYFFISEPSREKRQLQCIQKLDVRLWKATARQWLLVLNGFDGSSNNQLSPDMLLLLYLVFPRKSKVPPDIVLDSLVVQLDDSAHVIFDLTDYTTFLNEVVCLLGLVNAEHSISGINRFIYNLCFAGVSFERYSIADQFNFGAPLTIFSQVAHDATNMNSGPLRILETVLKSLRHMIDKELFHYHYNSLRAASLKDLSGLAILRLLKVGKIEHYLVQLVLIVAGCLEKSRLLLQIGYSIVGLMSLSHDLDHTTVAQPFDGITKILFSRYGVMLKVGMLMDTYLVDIMPDPYLNLHLTLAMISVLVYSNLEDKVLIEGGSIVTNITMMEDPFGDLANYIWDPGHVHNLWMAIYRR